MDKQTLFLSKTRYLDGLKCPKLLWYKFNRRQEIPPPSVEELERMKQGTIVGEMAQQLFPDGIKIERAKDPQETAKRSLKALEQRKPLFEAGFTFKQAYALADILLPAEGGAWDLIEVKSTSNLKDEHYPDAAFQKYVYEGNGVRIRRCYVMHLNNEYIRRGELNLDRLFTRQDITAEVVALVPGVENEVESLLKLIAGPEPEIKVGTQCKNCPLYDFCWNFLPEDHVFILRGQKKVAFDLMERGILKMKDIPAGYKLEREQSIQVESHKAQKPHIDRDAIRAFLEKITYPISFLDFESIAPAVPVYDGSRPYEDIPFQFSLYRIEGEGAAPVPHSFLAPGDADPRPELLEQLKRLLGEAGSIIAYSADYEMRCIRNAVRAYPEYEKWFEAMRGRFVDLLMPFKRLLYYSPLQEGSASIKDVLPALTGTTYEGMEIGGGERARIEYMRITFEKDIPEQEKERVRAALLKYCDLDTRGMIEILGALRAACRS